MMVTISRPRGVSLALVSLCLVLASVRGQEAGPGGSRRPQRRRCFTCRSRGDRGDCRDPFTPPDTEENRRQSVNTAVDEVPCSTGWCSKVGTAVLHPEPH